MKTVRTARRSVVWTGALCALLTAGVVRATLVTSNNLASQSLGPLTATNPTQASVSFPVPTNRLIAVKSDVTMTASGIAINGYHIDALSTLATATSLTDLVWTVGNFAPVPASYSQTHTLRLGTGANSSLYYNLGVGRWDFGMANYSWQATNMAAYRPATDDNGLVTVGRVCGPNLVPNASFENTNINFLNGGSFVSNAGMHGSTVLQIAAGDTGGKYIGVPVIPGNDYYYSFWALSPNNDAGNQQVEYGLGVPAAGYAVTAGNLSGAPGGGGIWKEFSGLFTPATGQTMFYIGAMSNGGPLWFDSFYVAMPEPAALGLFGIAGLLALRRRPRR